MKYKPLLNLILLMTLFVSTACINVDLDKFVSQESKQIAYDYVELIQQPDDDLIFSELDSELQVLDWQVQMQKVRDQFPQEKPRNVEITSYHVFSTLSKTKITVSMQYDYGSKFVLVRLGWISEKGDNRLFLINVNKLDQSLQEMNRFSLSEKPIRKIIFLFVPILILVFQIHAVVFCIRKTKLNKKWRWILLILMGVVRFKANLTTAQLYYYPLQIYILGFEITQKSQYEPWITATVFPLGVLIFWGLYFKDKQKFIKTT